MDNTAFSFEGPEVSPERLHDDLEAQKRYRQDASPIALRRVDSPDEMGQVRETSITMRNVDLNSEPAQRATYLELQGEPVNQVRIHSSICIFTRY